MSVAPDMMAGGRHRLPADHTHCSFTTSPQTPPTKAPNCLALPHKLCCTSLRLAHFNVHFSSAFGDGFVRNGGRSQVVISYCVLCLSGLMSSVAVFFFCFAQYYTLNCKGSRTDETTQITCIRKFLSISFLMQHLEYPHICCTGKDCS